MASISGPEYPFLSKQEDYSYAAGRDLYFNQTTTRKFQCLDYYRPIKGHVGLRVQKPFQFASAIFLVMHKRPKATRPIKTLPSVSVPIFSLLKIE